MVMFMNSPIYLQIIFSNGTTSLSDDEWGEVFMEYLADRVHALRQGLNIKAPIFSEYDLVVSNSCVKATAFSLDEQLIKTWNDLPNYVTGFGLTDPQKASKGQRAGLRPSSGWISSLCSPILFSLPSLLSPSL
jgi:hypothetical protein